MKKILSLLLITATVALSLCSCTAETGKSQKYSETVFDCFDTVCTVTAYDTDRESFNTHFKEFSDMLKEYSRLYDIYYSYDGINNIKTINDNAGVKSVEVDKRILDLLDFGVQAYQISSGRVNICMGSVLKIWHEYREADGNALPPSDELKAAESHASFDALEIDGASVYLNDGEASLDVGAIAKGYAAQQLCKYAKENLWESAVISLGGNVITYGTKDGDKWSIAIDNPDESKSEYLHTLKITDMSVVTSADTQRYYNVDGKRYCHIINPETLMPSEYMHSVTVICADSALADALSTALFNMPIEEGVEMVEGMENTEAVFVDMNYNEVATSGFNNYVKD